MSASTPGVGLSDANFAFDLTLAESSGVPAPATVLLFSLGLLGFGAAKRRLR